jgi:threonine/homoserine/homoserine lactone efflux protein
MKMAENQSSHRQSLEKTVVTGGNFRANLGVIFAFIFAMTIALIGGALIYYDKTVQGMIFAGVGLAGIVYIFIYGTRSQRAERERRDVRNRELTRRR